jgi:5,10-methylenetetrahydrofolate reductase
VYDGLENILVKMHPLFEWLGYRRIDKVVLGIEKVSKGVLFDSQSCGQCVLSSTGMACPMNCPKSLRNGPCGGVRADGTCEVDPEMVCVWVLAWEGNKRLGEQDLPIQVVRYEDEPVAGENLPIRPGHVSPGRLERLLRDGIFAVTTEISPPDSADPHEVYERARVFDGYVDAMNATDGSGGNCHMSSVGMCSLLTRRGYSMVMQVTCRDRNRIAIQGDVLGAAAMGVANILCLTGDDVTAGDHPEAKPVFDLDSMSMLTMLKGMRDDSQYLSGRKLTNPPRVFLGAAENPFAPPLDYRSLRLEKKVSAGAQFVQTQYCFDMEILRNFMSAVRDQGGIGQVGRMDPKPYTRCAHSGRGHQAPERCARPGAGRRQRLYRNPAAVKGN